MSSMGRLTGGTDGATNSSLATKLVYFGTPHVRRLSSRKLAGVNVNPTGSNSLRAFALENSAKLRRKERTRFFGSAGRTPPRVRLNLESSRENNKQPSLYSNSDGKELMRSTSGISGSSQHREFTSSKTEKEAPPPTCRRSRETGKSPMEIDVEEVASSQSQKSSQRNASSLYLTAEEELVEEQNVPSSSSKATNKQGKRKYKKMNVSKTPLSHSQNLVKRKHPTRKRFQLSLFVKKKVVKKNPEISLSFFVNYADTLGKKTAAIIRARCCRNDKTVDLEKLNDGVLSHYSKLKNLQLDHNKPDSLNKRDETLEKMELEIISIQEKIEKNIQTRDNERAPYGRDHCCKFCWETRKDKKKKAKAN